MNTVKRQSVLGLRILAPKLEKFSDRQIEVAQTWALHSRYTNQNRKSLHARACAEWINQRLSRT